MRRGFLMVIVVALFLAAFLVISLRRQPPLIPADDDHIGSRGRPDECMACHGPGRSHPRGPNHPFGRECWRCHSESPSGG